MQYISSFTQTHLVVSRVYGFADATSEVISWIILISLLQLSQYLDPVNNKKNKVKL